MFLRFSKKKKLWGEIRIALLVGGFMSVVAYYSKLERLWDEFNDLEPPAKRAKIEIDAISVRFSLWILLDQKSSISANHSFLEQAEDSSAMFVRHAVEVKKFKK
ncbi:hypothetical protein Leryth_025760 [Lithospermum erythrorhizon]|nr:hypothetical protein Leryth_025760 [Lithospermum erythrorhizon]